MLNPFTPGSTVAMTVTTTSTRVALPNSPASRSRTIVVKEVLGAEGAFIAFGDSTVTAALPSGSTPVQGYPVGAGSKDVLTIPPGVTHLAAIAAADGAQISATIGDGF